MKAFAYLLGFLFFVAVWWGGSLLVGSAVLPAPWSAFRYLATDGVVGLLIGELILTLWRGLVGFALALATALPIGVAMGRRRSHARFAFFPLLMLQSAPPLFWITPLVLWLGTRGSVPTVVAYLVSLPMLTMHTMMAIRHIPAWEYDVFAVYAPRRLVVARELYLPHLVPALKSNIHLGILVAVKAAMLAEWFAAPTGFGRMVRIYYQTFAMLEFTAWAFAFLLVVGAISFLLEAALKVLLPVYRGTPLPTSRGDDRTHTNGGRAAVDGVAPDESAPGALRVTDLTFGYGRAPLFQAVNLTVTPGRPMVLHGRSGCGKTTLLKCLSGVLQPWRGRVETQRPVGLVFQDDALLFHRDALGNVLLPAMPRYSAADVRRARECLALWGLAEKESAFPHELSGGMRKRLAMARVWFMNPRALLLDEPFVNLDKEARVAMWDLFFLRLAHIRVPTLIVTHYREEIEQYDVQLCSWSGLEGVTNLVETAEPLDQL